MAEKEKGGNTEESPTVRIREERRQRAMLGPLQDSFLRIPSKQ
jgi:hypothetical protein